MSFLLKKMYLTKEREGESSSKMADFYLFLNISVLKIFSKIASNILYQIYKKLIY